MRCRDQQGAVGVLLAIFLLAVAVPLGAAAVSTFARAATLAELQRSADAGALAGARSIPVGDLSWLPPDLGGGAPSAPLTEACRAALANLASDSAVGSSYAGDNVSCEAEWIYDPDFVGRVQSCLTSVIGNPPPPLGSLFSFLRGVLPSLHRPGIEVSLSRSAGPGPFDALIPGGDPEATEQRSARALRRFKNAIVVPIVRNPFTGDMTLDLNADLQAERARLLMALESLESATALLLPACAGVFDGLADDFADLYNPSRGTAPTTDEVVSDAASQGTAVMAFVLTNTGSLPCFGCSLQVPILDFVPVCVTSRSGSVATFAVCSAQAPGAFRGSLIR